jgi:hypothetical protein
LTQKEFAESEWNLNYVQPPENSSMACHIAVRFRKARPFAPRKQADRPMMASGVQFQPATLHSGFNCSNCLLAALQTINFKPKKHKIG